MSQHRSPGRLDRIVLAMVAASFLSACALAPMQTQRREQVARQIADDAVAFNEAYAQAVSAQILLNILRARDRQPRQYLSMSGIEDSRSLTYRESLGVSGTPLGTGGSSWGFGSAGVSRDYGTRPGYRVTPFDSATLAKAVFKPTPTPTFAHYWRSGYPYDLLLFLMVKRIQRVETVDGRRQETAWDNLGGSLRSDCRGDEQEGGCGYVRAARELIATIAGRDASPLSPQGKAICGLVEAYDPPSPLRAEEPANGETCEPVFVVGDAVYVMSLRSFDDIVYFIGDLMRPSLTALGEDAITASPLSVRPAGLAAAAGRRSASGAPLFRILPEAEAAREAKGDPRDHFAASVLYGGRRYFAGPPVSRVCDAATPTGICADAPRNGDRSSFVLSLLADLLALNQSPDALRAPTRLMVQ